MITASPNTTQAFLDQGWHAWERMATAYKQLGDRLGEALAYEPVHDAWMRGVIPHDADERHRPQHERRPATTGDAAQLAYKDLAEQTGSRSSRLGTAITEKLPPRVSAPPHEHTSACGTTPRTKWNDALDKKDKNNPAWKTALEQGA